jgi:hypothetical protein
MELKDLAHSVELGTEAAEIVGGHRRQLVQFGNQDVYQDASNRADLRFGNVNANTNVWANRSVGAQFGDIGSVVTYAPSVSLTQSNDNSAVNAPKIEGVAF